MSSGYHTNNYNTGVGTLGNHHDYPANNETYHYGVVGEGEDMTIAAFGSSLVMSDENKKAWACPTCTFWNAETMGKFCSMCGSPRSIQNTIVATEPAQVEEELMPLNDNSYNPISGGASIASSRSSGDADTEYRSNRRACRRARCRDRMTAAVSGPSIPETSLSPHNTPVSMSPHEFEDALAAEGLIAYGPNRKQNSNPGIEMSPEGLGGRKGSILVGDIGSPRTSMRLNKSINIFHLSGSSLRSDLTDSGQDFEESLPSPGRGKGKEGTNLSARDFQMSFANWSISDQGGWTCTACTFVNTNPLHLQCEICGQNRPANTEEVAQESQKAMQNIMEQSFRAGQRDFIRQQQDKIEEIEERIIMAERIKEITAMQDMLLHEVSPDEVNNTTPGVPIQRAQIEEAEAFIDDLEYAQREEERQQAQMRQLLENRRRELGPMPAANHYPSTITSSQPELEPHMRVHAQERMLTNWEQTSQHRSTNVATLREKQRAVLERWRNL